MEFLKNNGFTQEEINKIVKKYSPEIIETFLLNQDIVEDVIHYFREFGIKNIPRLMLERIDIFYIPVSKIKELFSHYEPDSIIKILDYDSSLFDEIV